MISCYFYMVFVPKYIIILFVIILIDYFLANQIQKANGRLKFFLLVTSLTANISILVFFKYFNFFNQNVLELFKLIGVNYKVSGLEILLPIGLSFHTFQSMSYTIEVYRGHQIAEKHLGYFANYVLFFPQMIAGPIEKFDHLGSQLKKNIQPHYQNFSDGFKLILFGLFVKMALADNIAPYVNEIYSNPIKHNSAHVLMGIIFFSFQIYADFFGYSTIAVGSAKLLGINIIHNFQTPYLSLSINQFWTRWHISLSNWFREYLYFPLGGNKVNFLRWVRNILIVFAISGLWHGASYTFIVWGLLHGAIIILERLFNKLFKIEIMHMSLILKTFFIVKTFLVASFIWVFFRAESFPKVMEIYSALVKNWAVAGSSEITVLPALFAVLTVIIFDFWLFKTRIDLKLSMMKTPFRWAVYGILIFGLMALAGTQKFTFIYFQF
jgi:alginate O-acetyltransferase complex protein AlgI